MRQSTGQASQRTMPSPSAAPNLFERASGESGSPVVMAASGNVPSLLRRIPEPERFVEPMGQDGHAGDAHARRVADGAEDRGRGGDEGGLADALRAIGPLRLAILDELNDHLRHVAD